MERVTYIIPVYNFDETQELLKRALESLKQMKNAEKNEVFFVGDMDTVSKCSVLASQEIQIPQMVTMVPTDVTDLFEKINLAVLKCTTPYFSILEYDDEFYPYWNEVAQSYIENERYSVILPMNELVTPKDEYAGFANEIAWDAAFVGEEALGFVKLEDLLIFKDFYTSGAYIKTEDFISLGKLKPEFKFVAWYEYLLNAAHEGKKIFVAPRIGYKHTILRDGAYMTEITKTLPREQGVALIQKAMEKYKPSKKD